MLLLCFYHCDGGAAAVMRHTNPVLHTARLNQAAPDVCNLSGGGGVGKHTKGQRSSRCSAIPTASCIKSD